MPIGHLLSCAVLFGTLLQVFSSSDEAQQKSVSAAEHYMNLVSSHAARSSLAADLDMENTMLVDKRRATLRRIEDLEAYQDHGQKVATMVNQASLSALSAGITTGTYKQRLSDFVTSAGDSRYVKASGNTAAGEYIKTELQDMGYEIHEIPWERAFKPEGGTNNVGSIVAFKKGTDLSNEAVVFGAHFDSVNWKDTSKKAPGVDDNGSGIAGLLSIAERLKGHSPRRNVVFVAFNGEEEGLLGSKSFVETVVKQHKLPQLGAIKGALIMDEVAFPGRAQYSNQAIFETVGSVSGSQSLVDTLAYHVADDQGPVSNFQVNWHGFGSDHISFLNAEIPALLLIERDDEWHADQVAHSDKDTFSGLSMEYGARMSRLGLRAYVALLNPSSNSATSSSDLKESSQPASSNLRFQTKLSPSAQKFQEALLKRKFHEPHVDV